MNFYKLGFYAGHKNVPLFTYIDFPDTDDGEQQYIQGWEAGSAEHLLDIAKHKAVMLAYFKLPKEL